MKRRARTPRSPKKAYEGEPAVWRMSHPFPTRETNLEVGDMDTLAMLDLYGGPLASVDISAISNDTNLWHEQRNTKQERAHGQRKIIENTLLSAPEMIQKPAVFSVAHPTPPSPVLSVSESGLASSHESLQYLEENNLKAQKDAGASHIEETGPNAQETAKEADIDPFGFEISSATNTCTEDTTCTVKNVAGEDAGRRVEIELPGDLLRGVDYCAGHTTPRMVRAEAIRDMLAHMRDGSGRKEQTTKRPKSRSPPIHKVALAGPFSSHRAERTTQSSKPRPIAESRKSDYVRVLDAVSHDLIQIKVHERLLKEKEKKIARQTRRKVFAAYSRVCRADREALQARRKRSTSGEERIPEASERNILRSYISGSDCPRSLSSSKRFLSPQKKTFNGNVSIDVGIQSGKSFVSEVSGKSTGMTSNSDSSVLNSESGTPHKKPRGTSAPKESRESQNASRSSAELEIKTDEEEDHAPAINTFVRYVASMKEVLSPNHRRAQTRSATVPNREKPKRPPLSPKTFPQLTIDEAATSFDTNKAISQEVEDGMRSASKTKPVHVDPVPHSPEGISSDLLDHAVVLGFTLRRPIPLSLNAPGATETGLNVSGFGRRVVDSEGHRWKPLRQHVRVASREPTRLRFVSPVGFRQPRLAPYQRHSEIDAKGLVVGPVVPEFSLAERVRMRSLRFVFGVMRRRAQRRLLESAVSLALKSRCFSFWRDKSQRAVEGNEQSAQFRCERLLRKVFGSMKQLAFVRAADEFHRRKVARTVLVAWGAKCAMSIRSVEHHRRKSCLAVLRKWRLLLVENGR